MDFRETFLASTVHRMNYEGAALCFGQSARAINADLPLH